MISKGIIESIKSRISPCLDGLETSLERAATDFKSVDPKISLVFSGFREKQARELKDLLTETLDLLRSPVYVGFLGRYSHGKSSLVNALLDLEERSSLPVGDQVTTSMVCVVEFDDQIREREFIAVELDRDIDTYAKFRKKITSQDALAEGSASSYLLRIPVNPSNDISKIFHKLSISLVDMPGLGGPFFDGPLTIEYLNDLDMLCIVVNACKVYESSVVLNDQLASARVRSLPKIVVATFWDQSTESDIYADCEDEYARRRKFKDLVREHMGSLANELSEVLFVDSVSDDNTGIKEMRQQIRTKVEGNILITSKIVPKKQVSKVFKKKISECRSKLSELSTYMSSSMSILEDNLKQVHQGQPSEVAAKREIETISSNSKKRMGRFLQQAAKKEIQSSEKEFNTAIKRLLTLSNENDFTEAQEEIEGDVRDYIVTELLDDLQRSYETEVVDPYVRDVNGFLTQYASDTASPEFIEDTIKTSHESIFSINEEFEFPIDVAESVTKEVKTIAGTVWRQLANPIVLIMLVLGIIILVIPIPRSLGSWIFKVDTPGIVYAMKYMAGLLLVVSSGIKMFATYRKVRERTFRATLKKKVQDYKKHYSKYIANEVNQNEIRDEYYKLVMSIQQDLFTEIKPAMNTARSSMSFLSSIKSKIEKARDDLEREIQKI